jgi:hypothetical protein
MFLHTLKYFLFVVPFPYGHIVRLIPQDIVSPYEPLRVYPSSGLSFRHRKASLDPLRCARGCRVQLMLGIPTHPPPPLPTAVPPILTLMQAIGFRAVFNS